MIKKILLILIIVLLLPLGFYFGFEVNSSNCKTLIYSSCHDGCSIATKDIDGYLTNETFECWENCNEYIDDVLSIGDGEK